MKLGENLGLDRFYLDKGTRKTVLPAREARGLDEGPSRAGPQVRNHGVIFAPGAGIAPRRVQYRLWGARSAPGI